MRKARKQNLMICQACRKPAYFRSRCLMQLKINKGWPFCINCCCLNKLRGKDCDDPKGFVEQMRLIE